jgi:hypothetical protein
LLIFWLTLYRFDIAIVRRITCTVI